MRFLEKRFPLFVLAVFSAYLSGLTPGCLAEAEPEASASRGSVLLEDIWFEENPTRVSLGNSQLRLEFDGKTGSWTGFKVERIPGSLLGEAAPAGAVDFKVDDSWMVDRRGAACLGYSTEIDPRHQSVSLTWRFGVPVAISLPVPAVAGPGPGPQFEYEVEARFTLRPGQAQLFRSARVLRRSGDGHSREDARHFEGFLFRLPGISLGNPEACLINVPGPFFPKTFVAPDTPYLLLRDQTLNLHQAPDAGFGILSISNPEKRVTLASWMDTAGEAAYRSSLVGDSQRLSFHHQDLRAYRMPPGFAVQSDTQQVVFTQGSLSEALASYRQMLEKSLPLDPQTPSWAREMVILEVFPSYFPEGLKGLTKKLPFYRGIGFNTVYLMPHWLGGYSPINLFAVDPVLGTERDLQEMARAAHALGMKVLFDMVIHGFNEKSPLPGERPQLFCHKEDGSLALHPTWKSLTTDWAAPAYQQYMADLVLHDLGTYDVDGYRVDAATYKGPNWDPDLPYPAYRSGAAAPELMRRMLLAMRSKKPEAVLLSEVFGPVFYSVCNLVHDNQTEAPQFLLEKMEAGQIQAAHYKAHLANVFAALPKGANRVCFARNHDTSWFYHFNGYTPRFMALEAVHALCVIPEVFAGDPKNGPHPDADPSTFGYYRKLFALRQDLPELARGELLLNEVSCDNPWVFTALRRQDQNVSLVAVSLSDRETECGLEVRLNGWTPLPNAALKDGISGASVRLLRDVRFPAKMRLTLKPFQVVVGRL